MEKMNLNDLSKRLLIIGLLVVFLGVLLAALIQSNFGSVTIKQLNIVTDEGYAIKAIFYLPKGVSKENKAPAVLVVHGGNSSRYSIGNVSQEFARRGYVVLSIDQSFNGQSDRGTNAFLGTEAAMKYITTLDFVDQSRLGVMGHSAGASVSSMAAENPQFNVKAGINLGAGPSVNSEAKINLAVIIGIKDENTGPRGRDSHVRGPIDYTKSFALANAFGVPEGTEVVPEREYGSLINNNYRIFYQPKVGHLGMLFNNEAIGMALKAMGYMLGVTYSIDVSRQTWLVRDFSTAAAFIGLFITVFGLIGILLLHNKELLLDVPAEGHATPNVSYWIGLAAMCVIPALAIQSLYTEGTKFFTSISQNVFAMQHINGVLFWMICTALAILVVTLIIKKLDKSYDWSFDKSILTIDRKKLLGYIKVALLAILMPYLLVYLAGFFGDVCIRIYNTEIHLFTPTRFLIFWAYLPIYLLYYLIIGYVQTSGLLCKGQSVLSQCLTTAIVSIIGPTVMLIVWYGSNGTSGINYLFAWRFVLGVLQNFLPGMAIGAIIQVYSYRRTGKVWLGALINSILFSWMATSIGVMLPTV